MIRPLFPGGWFIPFPIPGYFEMEGSRKLKGFFGTSAGLLLVAMASLWLGGDPTEIFKFYSLTQAGVAGGFFSFNFGEHWAKAKAANGNKETL